MQIGKKASTLERCEGDIAHAIVEAQISFTQSLITLEADIKGITTSNTGSYFTPFQYSERSLF